MIKVGDLVEVYKPNLGNIASKGSKGRIIEIPKPGEEHEGSYLIHYSSYGKSKAKPDNEEQRGNMYYTEQFKVRILIPNWRERLCSK